MSTCAITKPKTSVHVAFVVRMNLMFLIRWMFTITTLHLWVMHCLKLSYLSKYFPKYFMSISEFTSSPFTFKLFKNIFKSLRVTKQDEFSFQAVQCKTVGINPYFYVL